MSVEAASSALLIVSRVAVRRDIVSYMDISLHTVWVKAQQYLLFKFGKARLK